MSAKRRFVHTSAGNRWTIAIALIFCGPALHQSSLAQEASTPSAETASERFVPSTARYSSGATLEVRAEATVTGGEIKLRQVCRWADGDNAYFAPMADLPVAHVQGNAPFQAISLDEIRQTLHDAGANLGVLRFAGATSCTVARSDVKYDEGHALQQWVDAREKKSSADGSGSGATQPATAAATARALAAESPVKTLRDLIVADASVRLNVPADLLQITFNPVDDKVLNLSEPQFKFNLQGRRVFNLGEVAWDVLIVTDAGNKKVPITATARAWQAQVVLVRPVAFRQVIQSTDITEKRILSDHLPEEALLSLTQCIGQETSRELKPGTVLTARMVNPIDLAKVGQFITVTLETGNIRVKTVGRAMESGAFGQAIKVRNEAKGETYDVVLTGPQEGTISAGR